MSEEENEEFPDSLTALDSLTFQKIRLNYETAMNAKKRGEDEVAKEHLQIAIDELSSYRANLTGVLVTLNQDNPYTKEIGTVQDDLQKLELEMERELNEINDT